MKKIKLTQGKFALVNNKDFKYLTQWKWTLSGNKQYAYRQIESKKTIIYMHRLILTCPKNLIVDHIDHNGLNNQRKNLRLSNKSLNGANQRPSKKNKSSKYKGVTWQHKPKKWKAQIIDLYIGLFNTQLEAAKAYDKKAKKLFGKHAFLNSQFFKY